MPAIAHPFALFDALERRYDGPIPPHDSAATGYPSPSQRARLFGRLAAETRHEAACLRTRLTAKSAEANPRLGEIGRSLAHYRRAGVDYLNALPNARASSSAGILTANDAPPPSRGR